MLFHFRLTIFIIMYITELTLKPELGFKHVSIINFFPVFLVSFLKTTPIKLKEMQTRTFIITTIANSPFNNYFNIKKTNYRSYMVQKIDVQFSQETSTFLLNAEVLRLRFY